MRRLALIAAGLALAACSKTYDKQSEKLGTFDVAEPSRDASAAAAPQIAYSYTVAYTLAGASIATVAARQVALCKALGPARCQVVRTEVTGGGGDDTGMDGAGVNGEASLLVDARIAGDLGKRLDAVAAAAGGAVSGRTTSAEDVTKQVIDIEARVRAKQALADRLLGLIRTANGKVGDLVAAEKAYSDTQEELDAARGLQAELRRRVAMSRLAIAYRAQASDDMFAPVRRSAGAAGDSFGASIGFLMTFVVVALPWIALLALLLWIRRRTGWRWPFRRRAAAAAVAPATLRSD